MRPRVCSCGGMMINGKCKQCKAEVNQAHRGDKQLDDRRESSTARGYGYRWEQYAKSFRRRWPFCSHCRARGKIADAEHVDHIERDQG